MDIEIQRPDQDHATSRSFREAIAAGVKRAEVHGLTGSGPGFFISQLLDRTAGPLVIVTPDQQSARLLATDLRLFHGCADEIRLFPNWELRPYEPLSPHPEVEATRIATLAALANNAVRAVVVPVRALLQRLIPWEVLAGLCEQLRLGRDYPRDQLLRQLVNLGYQAVPLVEDRGNFSSRGDILDLFPPTGAQPLRLEFFGDTLEKIRPFDPATQRSSADAIEELQLLPAREMILAGECLDTFLLQLKARCDALGLGRSLRESIAEEAREGLLTPGHSFLLPLNYQRLDSFFNYAPDARWAVIDPPAVEQELDRFAGEVRAGEERLQGSGQLFVPAEQLFLAPAEVEAAINRGVRVDFTSLEVFDLDQRAQQFRVRAEGNGDLQVDLQGDEGGMLELANRLKGWQQNNCRVLLVCHTRGQAERLADLLEPYRVCLNRDPGRSFGWPPAGQIEVLLADLSAGFRLPDESLVLVTEEELFGRRARRRSVSEARTKALLSSLAELKAGDYIVHVDHGIGRYHGLQHLDMNGMAGDFLDLEYAGGDKLYLPIDRIEKVQKYVGGEGHQPRLDKMGGNAWEKQKLKARAAVEELARDLLQIYARRELAEGFCYSAPDRLFREFEAAFPYEETPDQLAAIEDVLDDMTGSKPMDRLICGDVGYGKTEVAIRSAFKAVLDGRQVAVLVPTTVLARQHYETFIERFKPFPVVVDMVSRFRSPSEQKATLEKTVLGQVDILVGTHRLLQRDVRFKNLGLIVIDEEQRFGVSHKERLKKLRAEVDVLTLTATPIPRTLHLSMMGLRDLSVIETPPVDRLAIRTYVTRFDEELVREAILRELRRGGQVFFVHNRVQNIEAMADYLRTLVPEAKIAVGHGQLGEKALEQVMIEFIEGRSNVLVCSTIIESGLDIPRANTIIINRADCFGLAQLYQLRGRVGRSSQRAYAYLLIPGEGGLTKTARERLRVLQELTELGTGFRIANHDLELRGAGDLLGGRQAGQIAAIGFEMYTDLLQETIEELQGREHDDRIDPEIRLGLSAFLPEKYVPDPSQRLVLYKRMAAADEEQLLYEIADELRDRYGVIPAPAELLLQMMRFRVMLKKLRIEAAEYDGQRLTCSFHPQTTVSPEGLLGLLQQDPTKYQFSADYKLSIRLGRQSGNELLQVSRKELQPLNQLC
jgi:transcription-repair coupling factor (superfamily II helicase)